MGVQLKVVTTTVFRDEDAIEEFLKNSGAFEPSQAIELLEERELTIQADDPNELVITPTTNKFTLKEV